jgi:hypothetical protein
VITRSEALPLFSGSRSRSRGYYPGRRSNGLCIATSRQSLGEANVSMFARVSRERAESVNLGRHQLGRRGWRADAGLTAFRERPDRWNATARGERHAGVESANSHHSRGEI